jgi:hypothetical protein
MNVMRHTDVTRDTPIEYRKERGFIQVHALKKCGCQGPWLGGVVRVDEEEYDIHMKRIVESSPVAGYLWAVYPVRHSNPYATVANPTMYVVGMRRAASALRDFVADRNARLKRKAA